MTCLWRSDRKLCFVVVCHVGFVPVLSSVTVLIENLCYLQWHVFTLWIIHTGLSFWYCKPLCFFLLSDVIHTVGPIARGNLGQSQRDDLESCYKYSLKLMKDNNLRSVVSIKAFKTLYKQSTSDKQLWLGWCFQDRVLQSWSQQNNRWLYNGDVAVRHAPLFAHLLSIVGWLQHSLSAGRALWNQFYFFPNSFLFFSKFFFFCFNFSGFIFFLFYFFLDSFLIVKLNFINQKACLIN